MTCLINNLMLETYSNSTTKVYLNECSLNMYSLFFYAIYLNQHVIQNKK